MDVKTTLVRELEQNGVQNLFGLLCGVLVCFGGAFSCVFLWFCFFFWVCFGFLWFLFFNFGIKLMKQTLIIKKKKNSKHQLLLSKPICKP